MKKAKLMNIDYHIQTVYWLRREARNRRPAGRRQVPLQGANQKFLNGETLIIFAGARRPKDWSFELQPPSPPLFHPCTGWFLCHRNKPTYRRKTSFHTVFWNLKEKCTSYIQNHSQNVSHERNTIRQVNIKWTKMKLANFLNLFCFSK